MPSPRTPGRRQSRLEENPKIRQSMDIMNAAEVIEEIKRLPPEEQGKVVEFTRHLPNAETIAAMEEALDPEKLESFKSAEDLFRKLDLEC